MQVCYKDEAAVLVRSCGLSRAAILALCSQVNKQLDPKTAIIRTGGHWLTCGGGLQEGRPSTWTDALTTVARSHTCLHVCPHIVFKAVLCSGDIITLPCAGDATSGESPLDLLSRRSDLSILFQAALAAGDEFVKTLNGE